MRPLRIAPVFLLLTSAALAQTYGVGRAPTAAELAQDITISPTGAGLPPGHGTAAEGKVLFTQKNCIACHGPGGAGGVTSAPNLLAKKGPEVNAWLRGGGGDGIPVKAPNAVIVWDFIHRGMPLGKEGSLTPDEVYALTAYLLYMNQVIPEDQVLDKESLPKVKMPIGDDYARLPEWKHGTRRLQGYPY